MMQPIRQKFVKKLFATNGDVRPISSYLFETNIFIQVSKLGQKLEKCKRHLEIHEKMTENESKIIYKQTVPLEVDDK